jgi:hypothetical protein
MVSQRDSPERLPGVKQVIFRLKRLGHLTLNVKKRIETSLLSFPDNRKGWTVNT